MVLQQVTTPPGQVTPYVISAYDGETLQLPGTKSVIRILASAKETNGAFSVFRMDGVAGEPVGFHYHNEAHDIFMCARGQLEVWAGDKARLLNAGDFAYVPPGIIHRPKLAGNWTETVGLITPGDWVDFFRFLSEPFDGILADEHDNRNIMAVLGPKFGAMKDKQFDVVMIPQHEPCPIGEWDENDTKLPKGIEPYFLKADSGPTWLLGGILSRPFITTTQNGGQFAISSIESSSAYGQSALSQLMRFDKVHHAFMVVNGTLKLRLDGIEHEIAADETAFVPAGQAFALSFASKYTRVWTFASGDGVETLIHQAGHEFDGKILPAKAAVVDKSRLEASAAAIAVTLVDKA